MMVFYITYGTLFWLGLISCVYANSVEKALEDTIKDALSIDLPLYNREEELFVNVINQDGYRICSAKINRHSHDELACKKEGLKHGDNTFHVTLYSLKSNTILKEAVTHFHYDNVGATWISRAFKRAQDNILCTFRSGDECTQQLLPSRWRTTGSKLASFGGVLLAGAYATYGGPLKLAIGKDIITKAARGGMEVLGLAKRARPEITPTTSDITDHDGRSPPPAPAPPAPHTRLHRRPTSLGLLPGMRRNMQKLATVRPAQYGAFLLTVGLMHRDKLSLQPIRTQWVNLQRRVTKLQLHRGDHVVVEIPVETPPHLTVLEILPPPPPPTAVEVPHQLVMTPQTPPPQPTMPTEIVPVLPANAPAVIATTRRRPSLVALLLRMRDALCAKFHAQPPARRQYWSRILATGVVVSVHSGTEFGKRITLQTVLVAVQDGLRRLLSSTRQKPNSAI